jgi:ribosomal RNA-processing protein 12
MVIGESDSEGEDENEENLVGGAYQESLTPVDGFTRGRNGRIKFNKDTKKRRRNEELEEDVEMEDGTTPKSKKNKQKAGAPKLGHTFKAKVCAANIIWWFR